jgi:hypothetical protein
VFENNNTFGCSFVMVWDWLVIFWEEHLVWDWADQTVERTLVLGLGRSHCGKNTCLGLGQSLLWEERRLRVFENEAREDIRA